MAHSLYLKVFPCPHEGREPEVRRLWAQRQQLIRDWDQPVHGLSGLFGAEKRRRRQNEETLAALDAALEELTVPPTSAFHGPRIGLDPEADAWFEQHVFLDPTHACELRRMLADEEGPFEGPLTVLACRQAFIGAPVAALEARQSFASLMYALPYPQMEFRLTAAWCRAEFPRQRWTALQWPQNQWPEDDSLPTWIPHHEDELTTPLVPPVAEQFANRFEAELLRALAPLPGLKGVPTRRLRTAALHVWRYAGDPPDETQDPDADPDTAPLPPLPPETRRKLSFAADLFDQVTWIRRWAGLGHPMGLESA